MDETTCTNCGPFIKSKCMEQREQINGTNIDLVQPKMSLTLSLSGMYQNRLFILGIGIIINK